MAYSKYAVRNARDELERRRRAAEDAQLARLAEVYGLCPEIKAIDAELKNVALEIAGAISLGKEECAARIATVKEKNLALQKRRAELLLSLGFDSKYTDAKYTCSLCNDTGYVDGALCNCYRSALALSSYEHSGLSRLIEAQSFESFSLDFYTGSDRDIMRQNYEELLSFARNFDSDKRSFLLCGATGLGKTHLSSAVARYLIDHGYDVVYETAQNMFADFERDRFRDRFDDDVEILSDKYFDCELLILDDLGTEMSTQFSVSCLYNVINTRLNRGLPIIASTNLSANEIRKAYHDRITSRLFGEFYIKQFLGKDVRIQKLKK